MQPVLIEVTDLIVHLGKKNYIPTGILRVLLAYVHYYRENANAVLWRKGRFLIVPKKISIEIFELLLNPPADFSNKIRTLIRKTKFSFWIKKQQVKQSFFFKIDYHGLWSSDYYKQLKKIGVRPIFMVHDLIPITNPEFFVPRNRLADIIENICKFPESIVITNCQTKQIELQTYIQQKKYRVPLLIYAFAASARAFTSPKARPIKEPYFVIIGTIEPRKNHYFLLHVWRKLVDEMGENTPKLVIIGQRGWECENVIDMLERCEKLRNFVIEHRASDSEVNTYTHHAQALLFPTFAEGFGLPLVESLEGGTPVIASNLAVFHEIAGDIPEYLDPIDGFGWLEMIKQYTDPDSPLRLEQKERIKKFKIPTWNEHFTKINQLLKPL